MPRSNQMPQKPDWWGEDLNGSPPVSPAEMPSFSIDPNDPAFQPPRIGTAPSSMSLSPEGEALIRSWEKGPNGRSSPNPYPSVEGGSDTVGWGHKIEPGENYSGGLIPDQSEKLFQDDLASHQRFVQKNVEVPLTQNQFDALVSLAYTTPSAFGPTTGLMKKLNGGDYAGAASEILRYDHGGPAGAKKVIPGLTPRRKGEWNMFTYGVYSNHQ